MPDAASITPSLSSSIEIVDVPAPALFFSVPAFSNRAAGAAPAKMPPSPWQVERPPARVHDPGARAGEDPTRARRTSNRPSFRIVRADRSTENAPLSSQRPARRDPASRPCRSASRRSRRACRSPAASRRPSAWRRTGSSSSRPRPEPSRPPRCRACRREVDPAGEARARREVVAARDELDDALLPVPPKLPVCVAVPSPPLSRSRPELAGERPVVVQLDRDRGRAGAAALDERARVLEPSHRGSAREDAAVGLEVERRPGRVHDPRSVTGDERARPR